MNSDSFEDKLLFHSFINIIKRMLSNIIVVNVYLNGIGFLIIYN